MKKFYFIIAAMVSVALTSCTNEFVGDPPVTEEEAINEAINFGFNIQKFTRGGDKVGVDAATILQSQFIVYGTKHTDAELADASKDKVVFQNYVVQYDENTAGTTESNTHNWEYVGKIPYAASKVSPTVTQQDIKYWDYSAANGYTFYGIASASDISNDHVKVTKTTAGTTVYDKGYSVTLDKDAKLDKLFVSDRLPVAKTDYKKTVTLTFRNFGARVRVGFYETVPGYKVKIDKFYYDGDATGAVTTFEAMDVANTSNFAASLQNIKTDATSNTMTVSYYNGTDGPENQVKLTASSVTYNYTLTLGTGVVGTELKTTSATPTWDLTGGAYTTVYPLEANTNPLLLKIDYTLIPEDGSNGNIEVKGANVVVPTQFVKWKSNFAYTYLFKISDNTNGHTGETTDPEGLYPITFDAVAVAVADDKTQETITNFENYSITTYANGSKVTTNDEYKVGETIYVVKVNNATNQVHTHTFISGAGNCAQVYSATTSGDNISEATVFARLTGSPNGITLTAVSPEAEFVQYVPAADGTNYDFGYKGAVKFTPGTAGTYVYVSTRQAYVPPTYTKVGEGGTSGDYSGTTTYYFKSGTSPNEVYYPSAGINANNFATYKASLYTKTAPGTPGEYDIKVIKVKS